MKNTPGGHADMKDVADLVKSLSKINEEIRLYNLQLENEEKIQNIENSFINTRPVFIYPFISSNEWKETGSSWKILYKRWRI